jgi:D-alanine-D-alanine ligase
MGGPSNERDISIRSGTAVYGVLLENGFDVVPIELDKASNMNGYKEAVIKKISSQRIDVAFIALHGEFGEDGQIQKILEEMNVSYTGSNPGASQLGMDKIGSKKLFELNKIPIPKYRIIDRHTTSAGKMPDARYYFEELGPVLVIKPFNEGSSIGLSIAENNSDFYKALQNAFEYSHKVIIEEYVRGREITVGILEDRPLPVVEIIPKRRFFDFQAKYEKGLTEYKVPAEIGREEYKACQKVTLSAHMAIGARFFSRIDMILSEWGMPFVLEVNTIPGLTELSLLPKAASSAGIDFKQLVLKILESALW